MEKLIRSLTLLVSIFLFLFTASGCYDSNSVQPESPSTEESVNHLNLPYPEVLPEIVPDKDSHEQKVEGSYQFNPEDPSHSSGGYLNSGSALYLTEGNERFVRNLEIYTPSTLSVNNQVYETHNVYSINRDEKILSSGKIINGKTWGSFKVVLRTSRNPVDSDVVLFEGNFTGKIELNSAKILLKGTGLDKFTGSSLIAQETLKCTDNFDCWTSNLSGVVKSKIFFDN